MNYSKIYESIVTNAKSTDRKKSDDEYYELHHIRPKCMGGNNDSTNLVLLTAREHFICHQLLTRIYPSSSEMHYAFWMMCIYTSENQKRIKPTSRTFSTIRQKIQELQRIRKIEFNKKNPRSGDKNGMYGSSRTGSTNPFYGKTHSKSAKLLIGEKNSQHVWTDKERQKLKDSWKNRSIIECPHCGKTSVHASNMRRYHFNKCKLFCVENHAGLLTF